MSTSTNLTEIVADLEPIVGNLIAGAGAARDAFNRHSPSSLEELQSLTQTALRELEAALPKLEARLARKSPGERDALTRLSGIYPHLKAITQNLGSLAGPIRKKMKDGVLFSDKAVAQTNYLFDTQTGMLRSVRDIIKTNNEFLKKYAQTEAKNLIQACNNFATEHETRLIEGVCLPQAAPLFLAILDNMRLMGQRQVEIVQLLS